MRPHSDALRERETIYLRNSVQNQFGPVSVYAMHMMVARIFELYFDSVNVIRFSTASCSLPLSLFIFLAHHFGFFTSFGVCVLFPFV